MPAVHVVGAVRRHHHEPLRVQHPAQERQQVASGLVGPVHVLQDQQDGAGSGELGEHPEHRSEKLLLHQAGHVPAGWLAAIPVRQQTGKHRPRRERVEQHAAGRRAGRRVAQGVGEGQVGHRVAELRAATGQDSEASRAGPSRELGDQPGLPDSGVAADQRDDWPAGGSRVEHAEQLADLGIPADKLGTRSLKHHLSIPADSDSSA